MYIAEYVRLDEPEQWPLLLQCGVEHAILRLPENPDGTMPIDRETVTNAVATLARNGLTVVGIEPVPPMENVKGGTAERDAEIANLAELLAVMNELDIRLLCYNFMAYFGWGRTRWDVAGRGGAQVTAFDIDDLAELPHHSPPLSDDDMWANYEYFISAIIPHAERANVQLALHPDDPPLSPYRGVARIMRTPAAIERALSYSASPVHGLTFCQGTFSTMGADIPTAIKTFGDRIKFVHFRDVLGRPERFVETFHDEGQTDMVAAMRAYREIGFDGPMRTDHVPTLAGEDNNRPGYGILGRLYAIGFIRGLMQATAG